MALIKGLATKSFGRPYDGILQSTHTLRKIKN